MLRAIWFVPPALASLAAHHSVANNGQAPLVQGTNTTSSDEQFIALCEGRQDFAITAMDNVIMWNRRAGPADFRIVAQVETSTGISLVARPGVADVAHLGGGRLLVDSPDNGFVVALRMMLADAGVAATDYTLVEAGGVRERFDVLMAGEGDATLLGPPFIDLAKARGFNALVSADTAYPGFPGQGVVVRSDKMAQLRHPLTDWLSLLEAARIRAKQAPVVAERTLVEHGLIPAAAAAMAAAIGETLRPDPTGLALLTNQRRALGLVGSDATYAMLVDMSLLDLLGAN